MFYKIKWQTHEEWLSIRHQYIGGSDASAVVGLNPYKSAYSLWAEKTDKIPSFEGNIATEVGTYLEEFVAQMFARETGKSVRRSNCTYVNDKYPFACANVDRLIVGEKALLEIKTTTSLPRMKKLGKGEFPDEWYAQVTHYLAVTELEKAYLAVLINCREFKIFTLERDDGEIDALMTAEREFWTHVENNTPPAIDGTQSSTDALDTIYPESSDDEVGLAVYECDLREYMSIGQQIKTLKEMQDGYANKVKAFMGESGKGISDSYKVSWASSTRSTFDSKMFAAENPTLDLSRYYKTTNVRAFKITERTK